MFYKILFYFISIIFFSALSVTTVMAADFTVSPSIINEKAQARDILEYTIILESKRTDGKLDVYVVVNDILPDGGIKEFRDPSELDKTASIARWTEIKRSTIEVQPGERKEVPLKIDVNMNAKPGNYYARIGFAAGSGRREAEEKARSDQVPTIILNIEVTENIVENVKIQEFKPKTSIFIKFPIEFQSKVENFGNQDVIPTGTIFIYNRRGQEEAQIKVNPNMEKIAPNTKKEYINTLDNLSRVGKYKAKIELNYGKNNDREAQDTVFFWILPWNFLAIFLGSAFFIMVLAIIFLFKKTYQHPMHHPVQQTIQQIPESPAQSVASRPAEDDVRIKVKKRIRVKEEE